MDDPQYQYPKRELLDLRTLPVEDFTVRAMEDLRQMAMENAARIDAAVSQQFRKILEELVTMARETDQPAHILVGHSMERLSEELRSTILIERRL